MLNQEHYFSSSLLQLITISALQPAKTILIFTTSYGFIFLCYFYFNLYIFLVHCPDPHQPQSHPMSSKLLPQPRQLQRHLLPPQLQLRRLKPSLL
ncbi:uncharacterized protein K452DRAFT_84052 [Aplosporella prunicola CBS 121167]|uniref:Uncharacterized protein n=1 Tax=Aplosporella prunicola CBS 121167 TaxID=1176127 RepID=A0A6A6B561_9PEZI|nr:uncharacterized protein K452DRAFT_84052 [Aplosporella prunicola CBS 121167]KAF2138758.1 hypothetical protein K452DRAFT_84052 [Aplosporella prunicola CBS 121167]